VSYPRGAVSIVEDYWAGVLQRLDAEVHVFAQLVTHEGERGRENEAVLARILEALVPQRYGIGTGLLIDNSDHYSRQTDIVVFDQSDEPAVLAQTTQLLFPIESVLACIEVKTTLRGDDLSDCFEKARQMRQELKPSRLYPDGSEHPLFIVLAYRAGQKPETLAKKLEECEPDDRPDLLCIVQQGLLMGSAGSIREGSDAADIGIALYRENGRPLVGRATGPELLALHANKQYPLVGYGQKLLLVDSSRALLLFVEALVRLLASRQARDKPVLSHYVSDHMRELAWYERGGAPAIDISDAIDA
jgi:hypothetical protein